MNWRTSFTAEDQYKVIKIDKSSMWSRASVTLLQLSNNKELVLFEGDTLNVELTGAYISQS